MNAENFRWAIMENYICPDCTADDSACNICPVCGTVFDKACSAFWEVVRKHAKSAMDYHDDLITEGYWYGADDKDRW